MIKNLKTYEKYKVLRPIVGEYELDEFDMPIIKKVEYSAINWNKLDIVGLQNATTKNSSKQKMIIMFNYDKILLSLWNNPLKRIALFKSYAAVATPDFSIYNGMNSNIIRNNVFMSRWLGVTWQNYGCTVIPTIGWGTPETYDISFSGVEYGSIVIISTIGCKNNLELFFDGFNELKKRINPPLIIVYGSLIEGMNGTFIQYPYSDAFNKKYEQLRIEEIPRVFTIKEVM